jgi:hypothetical protein
VTLKVESAMTNGRELRDQEHQEMLRKIVELQRRVALLEAKKAGNETISKLDEVIHQPEESARGRQPVDDLPATIRSLGLHEERRWQQSIGESIKNAASATLLRKEATVTYGHSYLRRWMLDCFIQTM